MAAIGQTRPTPGVNPTTIRTPLFILGVALALVAFLAMFAFGLLFANKTGSGAQIKVIIAARDIAAKEPISPTPDMVTVVSWPESGAPAQVLTSISQLSKTYALVAIPKGQPITANIVNSDPNIVSEAPYLPIPTGFVAMTIPTNEIEGVGGYITQGDYINISAGLTTDQINRAIKNPQRVVKVVFTDVYVLRVGPHTASAGQSAATGVTTSLTILLTQCDANYFQWLQQTATITYTLVSYHDYKPQATQQAAAAACNSTSEIGTFGATEVDARWHFTEG